MYDRHKGQTQLLEEPLAQPLSGKNEDLHIHGRQSKKSGATWWQPYLSIYLSVRLSRSLSSCPSDDLSIHIRFILFHSISSQRWHVIQKLKTSPSPSVCHPDDDTTNTLFFGGTMWQTASEILAAKTDLYMF
jgi:hypothetical protein